MTIQERGDALLTAYVNKDYWRVRELWAEPARLGNDADRANEVTIALHKYENPSITDTKVSMAVVESVNATRDYEAEARERNERHDAKRKLWALGYDDYFCQVTGISYWAQTENGERISDGLYDSYGISDPRKVLESLKK